jgi:5-methylcytosine-specific restriction protein B
LARREPESNEEVPLDAVSEQTGIPSETLAFWVDAINRKGQGVLYGPPGTGKTFVAEHLARHIIGGGDGFVELVQFHPAYTYEDFIQGLRPESREDGGLDYRLMPGRFLEFCRRASAREGECVLIIDEINRANLSRVFGELMYLLEYREKEVPLAGGERLRIPQNVRLIGTMNTADRSIALVDHALRRRFAFIALYPQYEVLNKFHSERGYDAEKLIQILQRVNRAIDDPHYEVGISFFLMDNLTAHLGAIWRMEIEPYLEEYFFDQPGKVDEFRWDKVAEKIL